MPNTQKQQPTAGGQTETPPEAAQDAADNLEKALDRIAGNAPVSDLSGDRTAPNRGASSGEGAQAPAPAPKPDAKDLTPKEQAFTKRFRNYDEAIKGLVHIDTLAGRHAAKIGEQNDVIKALNEQVATLVAKLDKLAIQSREPQDAKQEHADPFTQMIREEVSKVLDRKLAPLTESSSRQAAERYTAQMRERFGESWDALLPARRAMVAKMKSGEMREPEIWQLAVIGKALLDRSIEVGESQGPAAPPAGPVDLRSPARTKESEIAPPASADRDLEDILEGLPRLPSGVSRVR